MKKRIGNLVAAVGISGLLGVAALRAETWIDDKGRTIEARFHELRGDTLFVIRDGVKVPIPVNLLSEESLALAKSLAKNSPNQDDQSGEKLEPIIKNVLVINIDPIIESERKKRLTEILGWNDPRTLNQQYLKELSAASGGTVQWKEARLCRSGHLAGENGGHGI